MNKINKHISGLKTSTIKCPTLLIRDQYKAVRECLQTNSK